MSLLFRVEIPGIVRIKKNSLKRVYSFKKKRTVTIAGDLYNEWQNKATAVVLKAFINASIETIKQPLFARYEFHFENHQHEPDTSNCVEGPQDVLAKSGVIVNDKQIISFYAIKKFGLKPKTIVELYSEEPAA